LELMLVIFFNISFVSDGLQLYVQ
jgi:hypothetical protein